MIRVLVKNRLLGVFSGLCGKAGKRGRGNRSFVALLMCFLVLCLIFISASLAMTMGAVMLPAGAAWLYFSIFILAALTILFVLSIFETRSELFDCRDNDLLLSMPIPPRALVVSRLSVVLIMNYLIEAIIMLPALVVYILFDGSPLGIVGTLLVSLLIPPVATALAAGVGYLVALIARRFKGNSWFSLVLSLGFLALYFWGYNVLLEGLEGFLADFDPSALVGKMKVLEFIGNAALLKPLPTLTFVLASVLFAALAFFLIAKNYLRLATSSGGTRKAALRAKKQAARSPLFALLGKELRRFFSSSTYMLNSALGLILTLVIAVAALVKRDELRLLASELAPSLPAGALLAPICAVLLVAVSSVSNTMSASALSLEGHSLWIVRSLPLDGRLVLISKALPQLIVSAPPLLVSSVLFIIAMGASPLHGAFLVLTPLVACAAFSALGLCFNVLAPRFDFDNEAQPIKQSLPVFLGMLSQLLISIAVTLVVVVLTFAGLGLFASILALCFYAALAALFVFLLLVPGGKKYSSL